MIFVYCDGASKGNPGPASIGVSARKDSADGEEIFTISKSLGKATNNVAEWTALISALETSLEKGFHDVSIFMDSELVVKQVLGIYKVKHPDLIPFKKKSQDLISKLKSFKIQHVYRDKNKRADELANLALGI